MSIQAQPKTIFKDLFQQVFDAFSNRKTDDLQLKRWDHAADKLSRVSPGDGLEVKAHLAAIREQDDETDRLYSAALRATDDYAGAVARYLTLLAQRLRQEKLLEVFKDTQSALRGNPQATRFVERILASEGFLPSAWKLSEELSKMGSFSAAGPMAESELVTQVMADDEYDDADFGAPVAFVKRYLRTKQIECHGVSVSPSVSDDSDAAVFFQIKTDQSPEDAAEAEIDLFDALNVQSFPLETQGKIVFGLIGTRVALD